MIFKELDEDYDSWATGPNVREPGRWLLTIDKNDPVAKFLAACELVLPNEEVNARLDEINADRDDSNDAKRDEVVVPAGSVCVDGFQVAALTRYCLPAECIRDAGAQQLPVLGHVLKVSALNRIWDALTEEELPDPDPELFLANPVCVVTDVRETIRGVIADDNSPRSKFVLTSADFDDAQTSSHSNDKYKYILPMFTVDAFSYAAVEDAWGRGFLFALLTALGAYARPADRESDRVLDILERIADEVPNVAKSGRERTSFYRKALRAWKAVKRAPENLLRFTTTANALVDEMEWGQSVVSVEPAVHSTALLSRWDTLASDYPLVDKVVQDADDPPAAVRRLCCALAKTLVVDVNILGEVNHTLQQYVATVNAQHVSHAAKITAVIREFEQHSKQLEAMSKRAVETGQLYSTDSLNSEAKDAAAYYGSDQYAKVLQQLRNAQSPEHVLGLAYEHVSPSFLRVLKSGKAPAGDGAGRAVAAAYASRSNYFVQKLQQADDGTTEEAFELVEMCLAANQVKALSTCTLSDFDFMEVARDYAYASRGGAPPADLYTMVGGPGIVRKVVTRALMAIGIDGGNVDALFDLIDEVIEAVPMTSSLANVITDSITSAFKAMEELLHNYMAGPATAAMPSFVSSGHFKKKLQTALKLHFDALHRQQSAAAGSKRARPASPALSDGEAAGEMSGKHRGKRSNNGDGANNAAGRCHQHHQEKKDVYRLSRKIDGTITWKEFDKKKFLSDLKSKAPRARAPSWIHLFADVTKPAARKDHAAAKTPRAALTDPWDGFTKDDYLLEQADEQDFA